MALPQSNDRGQNDGKELQLAPTDTRRFARGGWLGADDQRGSVSARSGAPVPLGSVRRDDGTPSLSEARRKEARRRHPANGSAATEGEDAGRVVEGAFGNPPPATAACPVPFSPHDPIPSPSTNTGGDVKSLSERFHSLRQTYKVTTAFMLYVVVVSTITLILEVLQHGR